MKVAMIAPPWAAIPPVGYGGTEAVIDQLARGLQADGCDVVLFAVGESTCPVPTRSVIPVAEGMRIGSCVPELRHVMAAYDATAEPVLAATAGLAPAPVVTTNQGPFNDELNDVYRRIGDTVNVVAVSNDQAGRAAGVRLAAVIHHGVDPAGFPVGTGSGDYLLFLGRMVTEKGAHRAIPIARAAGKRLMIAAKMREEPERRYFEAEIEPLLGDDVEFVGETRGLQKLQLPGEAQALLNPIRWPEPFGMVMIEALACGTPVLSTREGAAGEIITTGTDGFLADTEKELVTAAQRFSTRRMTEQHLRLYEKILDPAIEAPGPSRIQAAPPAVAPRHTPAIHFESAPVHKLSA